MKQLTILLTAIAWFTMQFASYGQTSYGKIKGSIKDGTQKSVGGATITILKAKDSTVAKVGLGSPHYKRRQTGLRESIRRQNGCKTGIAFIWS